MRGNKHQEITVQDAARLIGVSPRTILNYLKTKEIEGIKVGKSWFLRAASVDAFCLRHGFMAKRLSENMESDTEIAENSLGVAENSEPPTENPKTVIDRKFSISKLRLFEKLLSLFEKYDGQGLFSDNPELTQRYLILKFDCLEAIGSGYYSFNPKDKLRFYASSREKMGAILALCYCERSFVSTQPDFFNRVEDDILPAYSALIKRIDKKNERTQSL